MLAQARYRQPRSGLEDAAQLRQGLVTPPRLLRGEVHAPTGGITMDAVTALRPEGGECGHAIEDRQAHAWPLNQRHRYSTALVDRSSGEEANDKGKIKIRRSTAMPKSRSINTGGCRRSSSDADLCADCEGIISYKCVITSTTNTMGVSIIRHA